MSQEFLLLVFFHGSVSPQPQSIPAEPFQIFSNIHRDLRKSRCTTGINDTSGKFATSFASVADIGGKFSTGVNKNGGKFATGDNDAGGKLPTVSTTPMANNGNNIRLLTT